MTIVTDLKNNPNKSSSLVTDMGGGSNSSGGSVGGFGNNTPNWDNNTPNWDNNTPNWDNNTPNWDDNTPNWDNNTPDWDDNTPDWGGNTSGNLPPITSGSSGGNTMLPMPVPEGSGPVHIYPPGFNYFKNKMFGGDQIFVYKDEYEITEGVDEVPEIKTILNDGEWSNGAVSKKPLNTFQFFSATLRPMPDGVRVGVGSKNIAFGNAAKNSTLFIEARSDKIIHDGNVVFEGVYQNFEIVRYDNYITVEIDSEVVASKRVAKHKTLHIYAQLYSIDDYIDDPKIEDHQVLEDSVQGDVDSGGLYAGYSSTMNLKSSIDDVVVIGGRAPQGENYCALYAVNALAVSDDKKISGKGKIPSFKADGRIAELLPGKGMASVNAPSFKVSSTMLTGGMLRSQEESEIGSVFVGKATENDFFGGEIAVYQGFSGQAYTTDVDDSNIEFYENMICGARYLGQFISIIAVLEAVDVTGSIDVSVLTDLQAFEVLSAHSDFTFQSILELLIKEAVRIKSTTGDDENAQRTLQYAVNAASGALSRYSNFEFIDYARAGNKAYAISKTGLYLIGDSDTDNGESIQASIDFGASDYGTRQGKIVSSIYAGISTDGQVYFRLIDAGGRESVYLATDYGTELRAKTAKGLISNMWRIKLEVVDATAIDLDNFEVELGVSQRRLRR